MNFDDAFEKLIGHEGGYQNDPRDSGNWTGGHRHSGELRGTKYGIAAASFPKLDIESLTLEQAKAIYKKHYWDAVINPDVPEAIRFPLFDLAVNSGVKYAVKILQRALGIDDDGDFGPVTHQAVLDAHPHKLANLIHANRLLAMTDMNGWSTYGKGWARRVATNLIESNS